MALSPPSTVAASIDSAIQAIGIESGTPITTAQRIKIWQAIVAAIYADIQSNAQVTVTGVQSGPGTAEGTIE